MMLRLNDFIYLFNSFYYEIYHLHSSECMLEEENSEQEKKERNETIVMGRDEIVLCNEEKVFVFAVDQEHKTCKQCLEDCHSGVLHTVTDSVENPVMSLPLL